MRNRGLIYAASARFRVKSMKSGLLEAERIVEKVFDLDVAMDWSSSSRCLLLGIAGSGMRALARILLQAGHHVSGADTALGEHDGSDSAAALQSAGFHLVPWLPSGPLPAFDVCVFSPAIPHHAPLLRRAMSQGIPVIPLHQAVGSLFADRSQVCIAGTHGKSTTSALLAWILRETNSDAGCFVGAGLCDNGVSDQDFDGGRFGAGSLAVIEACEFGDSFLHLDPRHVVLTGIDGDHFDWFADESAENASFRRLLARLPREGQVVLNAGCDRSRTVAKEAGTVVSAWIDDNSSATGWSASVLDSRRRQSVVQISAGGRKFADILFPLYGNHNVRNMTAAVAMASLLGVSAQQCQDRVAAFPGLRRRQEFRGTYGEMVLLDDYAHHPTAVKATLKAVRQRHPQRRLRAIFEPHQVVRVRRLWDEFRDALNLADDVHVLPVFPAREDVTREMCQNVSQALAAEIQESGTSATYVDGVQSAVSIIELTGQPGDLFLTMGAGYAHRIHDEVHRRFQRNTAA